MIPNNLSTILEQNVGHTDLIELCSTLLRTGFTREVLYQEFSNYLYKHSCDDELEESLITLLDILHGYHNPYVVVNEDGISIKIDN